MPRRRAAHATPRPWLPSVAVATVGSVPAADRRSRSSAQAAPRPLNAPTPNRGPSNLTYRSPAGRLPFQHFPHLAHDVLVAEAALRLRHQEITALVERGFPAIDVESRLRHPVAVDLARLGVRGADDVEMGPRRDPTTLDHRH